MIKHAAHGSIEKYKARFVAHGFSQEGIDYEATFAPIGHYTTIRIIIIIAVAKGSSHGDMKTAFLNGVTKEKVCIKQHKGFVIHGT